MEELKNSIFSDLKIPSESTVKLIDKTLFLEKWEWDYQDFLTFQKQAQLIIQKNRDYKVYIFCNHPHCFTLGRGNERGQEELVDFNKQLIKNLKYKVHTIHRGGGITFHYPGQWIFYPVVAISSTYTLDDHMCLLLKSVTEVLKKSFSLEKAMTAKKLMGIWCDRQKLASIGIGLNRFVTEHGLALNLNYDVDMFEELKKINPCGMNPTTYIALSQLKKDHDQSTLIEKFHREYTLKL